MELKEDNMNVVQKFPMKLWNLINSEKYKFLEWGRNGTTILIDIDLMEDYMATDESVFRTKNVHSLMRQMNLYGFRKTTNQLKKEFRMDDVYIEEYRNDNFKQDHFELLSNIVRRKPLPIDSKLKKQVDQTKHKLKDKSPLPPLQKARQHLRQVLQNDRLMKLMHHKLELCEQNNYVLELSDQIYEAATESHWSNEESSIAGYYDEASSLNTVEQFFNVYLPTYSSSADAPAIIDDDDADDTLSSSAIIYENSEAAVPTSEIHETPQCAPPAEPPIHSQSSDQTNDETEISQELLEQLAFIDESTSTAKIGHLEAIQYEDNADDKYFPAGSCKNEYVLGSMDIDDDDDETSVFAREQGGKQEPTLNENTLQQTAAEDELEDFLSQIRSSMNLLYN